MNVKMSEGTFCRVEVHFYIVYIGYRNVKQNNLKVNIRQSPILTLDGSKLRRVNDLAS